MEVGLAFAMRIRRCEGVVVLALTGELDMATAPDVQSCLDELLAGSESHILVDLTELTFCDSAGLNTFVRGDRQCGQAGGWLRLTGANGHVARVLELSGLQDLLSHRPDADGQAE